MLELKAGAQEGYDESTNRFVKFGGIPITMEHSLISLSKWEETWEKSFLSDDKSDEEMKDYIRCMLLPGAYTEEVLDILTPNDVEVINNYINAKRTATIVPELPGTSGDGGAKKRITSEQIYGWMVALQIDWRSENWYLNRLLTLIRVVNINNSQDGKKSKPVTDRSALNARAALNAKRRAQYNTSG